MAKGFNKTIVFTIFYKVRGYIQKFPDWVDNEIYAYNIK
jgi:hypothetical protein